MQPHDETRLRDMLDAAHKARAFMEGVTRQDLLEDEKTAYAVVRALEIIGEAASRVSLGMREAHPEIAWNSIIGMRNKLVHDYISVDLDIVWQTVQNWLPGLIQQLENIMTAR